MTQSGKRLTILSNVEINTLYKIPKFNDAQRDFYFTLRDPDLYELHSLRSVESRVHFILQLGYFKCKFMFFSFTFEDVGEDVFYILRKYFPTAKMSKRRVAQRTLLDHQSRILKLLNFKPFDQSSKKLLEIEALRLLRITADLRYILDALFDFLIREFISIPGYSTLQKIISRALLEENERLQAIMTKHIPRYVDKTLHSLLDYEEGFYGITVFKKDAKGFTYKEVMHEIDKKGSSAKLYKFAEQLIPKLKVSWDCTRYYASLVDYYTIDRLRELSYKSVRLYLLCYIFYRFQKINDNLVNSFIYRVNSYKKNAKEAGKQGVYQHKVHSNISLKKVGQVLALFIDDKIADETPFGEIKQKAFKVVTKEQFPLFTQTLQGQVFDENEFQWDYYLKSSRTISKNLRPLACSIDFESEDSNDPLIKALMFLKETFKKGKSLAKVKESDFPEEVIPKYLAPYLYILQEQKSEEPIKKLSAAKYEFLVYERLEKQLASGKIFVGNSISFKSFKSDCVSDERWKSKDTLIKSLNNPLLNMPIKDQLEAFRAELEPLFLEVNQRIQSGANKEIILNKKGQWSLLYKKRDHEVNNPFYARLPQVSLSAILHFVNENCNFIKAFTPLKSRYAKTSVDKEAIFACITADATNYGIAQLSQISDISYSKLISTSKTFIRLENLKKGNDILINAIFKLPMFKRWNLLDNQLFSSLDGKKYQTRQKNILARYSGKYFGRQRGVVAYSMVANHVCLNTQVIGANEHESHYLFDMIFNNTSDIQPQWHSGDTHSINRVNFALLHLINQKFAPHFKNIRKKALSLCCFKDPRDYENYLLVPEGKFNTALIEEEWDNIQRIFVSLLLKETTQSIIVKKLSSYERSNKTQRALWEFDKILMTLHALRFIDDPLLRRCERIALNRGEAYHQLAGKIAGVNGNKFRGSTELELQIWNECMRFVANCITYYNTSILSKVYERQEKLDNQESLEFITRLSPIAWRHINLNGTYEFTNSINEINLDEMVKTLDIGTE